MSNLPLDQYGRNITMESMDVYTVDDGKGNIYSVGKPIGTSLEDVYSTINAMAPPAEL